MSDGFDAWLAETAAARADSGLHRSPRRRSADDALLDLSGNDYLGLARDPRVVAAGIVALRTWGAGSTGSRLVSGTTTLHAALEDDLAAFVGTEASLVFATGYAANLGAITALSGAGSLVVSDAANHASIVDACRLSRARVEVVPSRDPAAVDRVLAARREARALVVTDAVFSTDGALAPLAELHDVCRAHGAVLVVDEAHAVGVVGPGGRGACAAAGLAGEPDVVITVTLSKSLGSQGGGVLAAAAIVEHLVDTARTFIFDTALAPAAAGAAREALRTLTSQPSLADDVRRHARSLAAALGVGEPPAAVVPVVLGDPHRAVAAAAHCRDAGVLVGCFRPPSVPAGGSMLRLTARADLTAGELARAVDVIARAIA
jgi:8-amino-7-oxononanoate synthase